MRRPSHILFLLTILCALLTACGGASTTSGSAATTPAPTITTLNIFAAASLNASFTAIKTHYQLAHPTIKVVYNFAGSQALVQQIIQGANADVFASADQTNMKKITTASLATNPQTFADNTLAVILPTNNPAHLTTLKDLARKGVKIDVAASTVPVGSYTLQVLTKLGQSSDYGPTYENGVKANFVSQEENDTAIVQKVELGEVDAGIVYSTDVSTAAASKVQYLSIPTTFNIIAQYPITVLKNSSHANDAQAFVQYILSSDGQAILAKYHFLPPTTSNP